MVFSSREKPGIGKRVRNAIWPNIGFRRAGKYMLHRLSRISSTPHVIALGFATGAFASFTPLVGFHFVLAALFALVLRANIVASAVGTVVGNPLTFPFIWAASYNIGAILLGIDLKSDVDIVLPAGTSHELVTQPVAAIGVIWQAIEPIFLPMIIGGLPLGAITGLACYWSVRAVVGRFQARRKEALLRGSRRAIVPGE